AEPYLAQRWAARQGRLNVWSAGCASGEEPYTIAVVLAEAARAARQPEWLARAHIDATDIDRASLERTRTAQYPATAFDEMPPALKTRYFTPAAPHEPLPVIRGLVSVIKHDMLRDKAPHAPYDLIVCRNVVLYFDRPTQEQLFALFASAPVADGILLPGKVETLFGPARDRLKLEDPRERIYRRIA